MGEMSSTAGDDWPRIKQRLQDYGPGAPLRECVRTQGDCYGTDYEYITVQIDQPPGATRVAVSSSHTAADRTRIETAVRAVDPQPRCCFANALRLWNERPDVEYVEGFAVLDDHDHLFKHAWNLVDGTFFDVTPGVDPFVEYYGIVVDDADRLNHCVEIGQERDFWGVLDNHLDNHQYLRDQGFH